MKSLKYHSPASLEEASSLLVKFGAKANLLAGCTDLLVKLRGGQINIKHLISVKFISGLDLIEVNKEVLKIGAFCKVSSIEDSPVIKKNAPDLAQAAGWLGSRQIRNLATLGGNLCNAAPSAELAPPLISAQANAIIFSRGKERFVPIEKFFRGPGVTCLEEGEILKSVEVPMLRPLEGRVYLRHCLRRSMDISVVNVGISASRGKSDEICKNCVIALGAVAPTPIRARRAEELITDAVISKEIVHQTASVAAKECKAITDVRGSADYRGEVVEVLVRRGLEEVFHLKKNR
jgi:carbon-monoxide dehydrogenase medium subunit